jgi:hypothetical protein
MQKAFKLYFSAQIQSQFISISRKETSTSYLGYLRSSKLAERSYD